MLKSSPLGLVPTGLLEEALLPSRSSAELLGAAGGAAHWDPTLERARQPFLYGGPLRLERLTSYELSGHQEVVEFIESDLRLWRHTFLDFDFVWVHNNSLLGLADTDHLDRTHFSAV